MNSVQRFRYCSLITSLALSASCSIRESIPSVPIASPIQTSRPELFPVSQPDQQQTFFTPFAASSSAPFESTASADLPPEVSIATPMPISQPLSTSSSSPIVTPPPTPTPILTASPSPTPSALPTRTPTPAATPLATFVKSPDDPRFEEYRVPAFSERRGPPGIKPYDGMYGAVYPVQVSVEQQSGNMIAAWRNYKNEYYYNQNNLKCFDTQNLRCREIPGYFEYDAENDYWHFIKDLNASLPVSWSEYLWWGLNKLYQTSIDPSWFDYQTYRSGLVSGLDSARSIFWVYQMKDMPEDVNGTVGISGSTPGIPYPPVRVHPSSWVSSPTPRGLITAQNALTYSPDGLLFLESEQPDYILRIHYYAFAPKPKERVWTTKTFSFKTGPFRSLSVDNALAPQVAFSKKDTMLYFMSRYWETGWENTLKTLVRLKKSDAM
ncbi:MAG: hypothetical protein AAB400_01550 [Patescibacteria group bacterium]